MYMYTDIYIYIHVYIYIYINEVAEESDNSGLGRVGWSPEL